MEMEGEGEGGRGRLGWSERGREAEIEGGGGERREGCRVREGDRPWMEKESDREGNASRLYCSCHLRAETDNQGVAERERGMQRERCRE